LIEWSGYFFSPLPTPFCLHQSFPFPFLNTSASESLPVLSDVSLLFSGSFPPFNPLVLLNLAFFPPRCPNFFLWNSSLLDARFPGGGWQRWMEQVSPPPLLSDPIARVRPAPSSRFSVLGQILLREYLPCPGLPSSHIRKRTSSLLTPSRFDFYFSIRSTSFPRRYPPPPLHLQ